MTQIKLASRVSSWAAVLSEVSHVFCCALPYVFSVLTILVSAGAYRRDARMDD